MRLPIPHTSSTPVLRSTQSRLNVADVHHPAGLRLQRLAVWLASLARVLVRAMPTPTGMPVQRSTRARISRPNWVRLPGMPVKSAKHSSMLYTSAAGTIDSIKLITRSLMSPYSA
jgi:hypothetical protein